MGIGPNTARDADYRRGVVLGLTIGEAILLLLFSLLLVLAVPLIHYTEQNRSKAEQIQNIAATLSDKEVELSATNKDLSDLRERVSRLEGASGKRIEDITKEYSLAADRFRELEKRLAAQERRAAAFKHIVDAMKVPPGLDERQEMDLAKELAEQAEAYKQVAQSVSDALGSSFRPSKTAELVQAISKLAADGKSARLGDLDKQALVARVMTAEQRERDLSREYENTKGQFENLKRQVADSGRGVDAVPCWSTSTGRPEYIFDVALTTRGLVVRDRGLVHRQNEQALLPTADIPFGIEIAPQRFLVVTKRLFDWSVQHECRFFVRAFDRTGDTEKTIFKRHLRFLETHFYKYEELNEPF